MYTIVLLTEDALTDHDVDRVVNLHGDEPVRVHVLVPVDTDHNPVVEALDEAMLGELRDAVKDSGERTPEQAERLAGHALARSLEKLRAAGVDADGGFTSDDPVEGTITTVRELDADEVVVLTEPHLLEGAFHRDWASRIRRKLDRPVLHAVAGTDRVYD
ncbi:MAG: hypothetical protein ACTHOD_10160 [Motilibacteraceae bacterium]